MSNSYNIKSVDSEFTTVDFVVGGKVLSKRFDSRYLPIQSSEELDEFMSRQLSGLVAGKIQEDASVEIADDVKALVGKKKSFSDEEIAELETKKALEAKELEEKTAPSVEEGEEEEEESAV